MERHKQIYLKHFNYDHASYAPCEFCQKRPGSDVHHISGRGDGKDVIENLMLLCRYCHTQHHDFEAISEEELQAAHDKFMRIFNIMKEL